MSIRFVLRTAAPLAALTAFSAVGCKDSPTRPPDPLGIRQVLVGVQVDSATFRNSGQFVLAVVPIDGNGRTVLSDTLTVEPALKTPAAQPLPPTGPVRVQAPDARPTAVAIDIDDSKSTLQTDPQKQRADAARLFWQALLAENPGNQVALLSFGGPASTGFAKTTLLQTWTSDASALETSLGQLHSVGDTYLYESMREVATWTAAAKPVAAWHRAIVLVTDGKPNARDSAMTESAISAAVSAQVPVYTVGIGSASDQSSNSSPEAVARLRTIANRTGAVYAGTTNAAGLQTVFKALATVSTKGALLVTVQVSPIPAAGTSVGGNVRVSNPRGGAAGDWSFVAQ